MTVEAPPPVGDESLPPWAGGLPAAAVALRTLLHRVDSTATPLWAGPALNAALLRYEHIFLPMYAAHLDATGVITLTGAPREAAHALVAAATAAADTTLVTAAEAAKAAMRPLAPEEVAPWTALRPPAVGGVATVPPVPPLDVAFVWALARLDTVAYAADCVATFGTPLPVGEEATGKDAAAAAAAAATTTAAPASADAVAHVWAGNATESAAVVARLQWVLFATAAQAAEKPSPLLPGRLGESLSFLHHRRLLRRQHLYFLPGYLWPPVEGTATVSGVLGSSGVGNGLPRAATVRDRWEPRPRVAALRAAAASQRVFTRRLGASGWDDPAVVRAAVARYVRFLGLASTPAGANTFLVPTTDMDLVWHAHLMATAAYEADTTAAIGRVYPHVADDDVSVRGRLASGRAATTALWAATYPEHPYEPPPSLVVPCDPASTAAKGASKPSAVDVIAASAYASGVRGGFWPAGAIERASVKAKVALREEVVAEATAAVVAMDGLVAKRPPTGLVARRAWERSLGVATAAAWRRRIGPAAVPGGGWPGLYARGYVLSAGDPLEVAATPAFVDPETARGSAGAGAVYMSASSAGTACGGWGVGGGAGGGGVWGACDGGGGGCGGGCGGGGCGGGC